MEHLGFRDAIHVPYIIVTCDTELQPGDKVSLRNIGYDRTVIGSVKWGGNPESGEDWCTVEPMWHGVADPFRENAIPAGEAFSVWIRKECFSGLTHSFQIEVNDRGGTNTCHSVCDIF